jgi:hypothetical protein
LSELEIIGYADCLSEEFVPQVVPPIFRPRGASDRVVMPPFLIEGYEVTDVEPGLASDFKSAILRGQATRLATVIAARPGYRLWVDESFEPHYEPSEAVSEKLRKIAQRKAREAQQALVEGQMEEAMHLAQAAISADDGCLNAILVKALAHRLEDDQASVEILSDIAETVAPGADLISWVDFFAALVLEQAAREAYRSASSPASLIAEAAPVYGALSESIGWPGFGGRHDVGDPGSSQELAEGLFSRLKILSEVDFDLGDETEQLVM